MEFYLVRHGETDFLRDKRCQGHIDVPLNDTGRKQAEKLALALSKHSFDAIHYSPLKRTLATARAIKLYQSTPLFIEEPAFKEIDQGKWSGLTTDQIRRAFPKNYKRWQVFPATVEFQGGESIWEFYGRVRNRFVKLALEYRGKDNKKVLIVSHHEAMNVILNSVLGIHLNDFKLFGFNPASISIIRTMPNNRWQVVALNDTSHLR